MSIRPQCSSTFAGPGNRPAARCGSEILWSPQFRGRRGEEEFAGSKYRRSSSLRCAGNHPDEFTGGYFRGRASPSAWMHGADPTAPCLVGTLSRTGEGVPVHCSCHAAGGVVGRESPGYVVDLRPRLEIACKQACWESHFLRRLQH